MNGMLQMKKQMVSDDHYLTRFILLTVVFFLFFFFLLLSLPLDAVKEQVDVNDVHDVTFVSLDERNEHFNDRRLHDGRLLYGWRRRR